MNPRFTPLACLIAILVLLAPVPGLADGIEVADKQGVPAQNPAPAVTAGEEVDDPEDNPDQGAGWQMPGGAARKNPRVARPVPRREEPPDEDAADNPDQGQGWQAPGRGGGK